MTDTRRLYQFGNSVCCQKVRVTLSEKGLEWTAVEVDLFKNEQYAASYLKLNPAGVVPTLLDDGEVVTESSLICECWTPLDSTTLGFLNLWTFDRPNVRG